MTFGERINEIRVSKNLSLREVARRSDISHPYLSQLETGRNKNPTPDIIRKLSKGLNVPYMELMKAAGYAEEDGSIPVDSLFDAIALSPSEIDSLKDRNIISKEKESKLIKIYLDNVLTNKDLKVYYKDKLISNEDRENINQLIDIHLKGRW